MSDLCTEKVFIVEPDATILTMYDDNMVGLGKHTITRASEVEADTEGKWFVKLGNDPELGEHAGRVIGQGFSTRQAALDFEVQFINQFLKGKA